jgi:hypothetical protein
MRFKVEVEITPHADGVHCGECVRMQRDCTSMSRVYLCDIFHEVVRCESWKSDAIRCPDCLDAEQMWEDKLNHGRSR